MDDQIKARLIVRLLANDVVVAESDDAGLWDRTFSLIRTGTIPPAPQEPSGSGKGDGGEGINLHQTDSGISGNDADTGVAKIAKELGIETSVVQAALGPT